MKEAWTMYFLALECLDTVSVHCLFFLKYLLNIIVAIV